MKIFKNKKFKKYVPVIFFVSFFILFLVLSFFRDAQEDENIYMGEAAVIADLLKQGKWIGNYGVGLHGFLSKLFIGIIYIFTGPSVFVATLFNVILGVLCGVVFYKILQRHFKFGLWALLLGTTMLFCSYQFITYIPTFYRDIGVLFSVLLFIYSVLEKKSKWISGLFLMLILDSKEHVFYTLAPAILIWIVIESFRKAKDLDKPFMKGLGMFMVSSVRMFLPSLAYLVLMFTSSLIPMNIYNANILGVIDDGLNPLVVNFDPQYATINRDIANNPSKARVIPLIGEYTGGSVFVAVLVNISNMLLPYVGKVSYPRTFSYISVPFIVAVPALVYSLSLYKKWVKNREYEKLLLPLSMFFYIFIYVVHASISRYILPVAPIIILFFLLFLLDFKKDKKKTTAIFLITVAFVTLGLFFEYSYVLIKVIFSVVILFLIGYLCFFKMNNKKKLVSIVVLLLSGFTAGASILASNINGQIGASRLYGYNRECEQIIELIGDDKNIWINDIGWDRLPFVLRSENVQNPEWRWALQSWIPKKWMFVVPDDYKTYSVRWRKELVFKDLVDKRGIDTIVYIDLHEKFRYDALSMQERLPQISSFDWLELRETKELKNKTVYIFEVRE